MSSPPKAPAAPVTPASSFVEPRSAQDAPGKKKKRRIRRVVKRKVVRRVKLSDVKAMVQSGTRLARIENADGGVLFDASATDASSERKDVNTAVLAAVDDQIALGAAAASVVDGAAVEPVEATPPVQPKIVVDDESWSCPTCTFVSPRTKDLCGVCSTPQPGSKLASGQERLMADMKSFMSRKASRSRGRSTKSSLGATCGFSRDESVGEVEATSAVTKRARKFLSKRPPIPEVTMTLFSRTHFCRCMANSIRVAVLGEDGSG